MNRKSVPNILKRITELKKIVESILLEKNLAYSIQCENVPQIPLLIMQLTKLFNKQVRNNTLSNRQRIMMNLLIELEQNIQKTKIKEKEEIKSTSLMSFLLGENKDLLKKMNESIE